VDLARQAIQMPQANLLKCDISPVNRITRTMENQPLQKSHGMYYARATRHKRSEHLRDKRRSVAFIKLVATWTDISRNVACPRPVRHYYGSIVPAASSQGVYHGAINRCISDFNISSSFSCQSRLLATKMEGMAKFPVSAGAPARNVIRDGVAQAPPSTPNPKSRRYRTTRTLLLHELRSAHEPKI
jgi:hypothetical protein